VHVVFLAAGGVPPLSPLEQPCGYDKQFLYVGVQLNGSQLNVGVRCAAHSWAQQSALTLMLHKHLDVHAVNMAVRTNAPQHLLRLLL